MLRHLSSIPELTPQAAGAGVTKGGQTIVTSSLGKAQSCLDRVYNTLFSPFGLEELRVLTGERTSPLKRLMGTGLRR